MSLHLLMDAKYSSKITKSHWAFFWFLIYIFLRKSCQIGIETSANGQKDATYIVIKSTHDKMAGINVGPARKRTR
jgi:hypothetical protein